MRCCSFCSRTRWRGAHTLVELPARANADGQLSCAIHVTAQSVASAASRLLVVLARNGIPERGGAVNLLLQASFRRGAAACAQRRAQAGSTRSARSQARTNGVEAALGRRTLLRRRSAPALSEVLNLLDDHSRLCVGSDARRVFKAADVVATFRKATAQHGLPASMLSDNGAVFTGSYRGGGRVALELALAARGIRFTHSRPCHPQTCGKVERFHQTLKSWLAKQPPASSTPSATTTTTRGRTAPWAAAPRPRFLPGAPRPSPQASRWTLRTSGSGKTAWTRPASSRWAQQPSAPHRRRPPPRRAARARPRQGPAHPRPHRHRRAAPRTPTRPVQGLPATAQTVNDVSGHLCTVSRDITCVRSAGFEPATS